MLNTHTNVSLASDARFRIETRSLGTTERRTIWLWVEMIGVFLGMPLLIYSRILPNWPIPMLILITVGAFCVLAQDASFDRFHFFRLDGVWKGLGEVLVRDALLMALLGLTVLRFAPQLLFSFIKANPAMWLAVVVLYPLFSVYPQEVLFRAYFFKRYEPLFGNGAGMITASALAFGFVHIIFGHWISVVLSAIGGVLFSLTYRRSGSLMLACIEHALFGDFIFTIGIGSFFVHAPR